MSADTTSKQCKRDIMRVVHLGGELVFNAPAILSPVTANTQTLVITSIRKGKNHWPFPATSTMVVLLPRGSNTSHNFRK